jgi:hypothetical protein
MWPAILSICLESIVWLALVLGALTLFEIAVEKWGG